MPEAVANLPVLGIGKSRVTTEFRVLHVLLGGVCFGSPGMHFSVGLQGTSSTRGYVLGVPR